MLCAADAEARLAHGGLEGFVLPLLFQLIERRRAVQSAGLGFLPGYRVRWEQ
jgi:hypothetical protein